VGPLSFYFMTQKNNLPDSVLRELLGVVRLADTQFAPGGLSLVQFHLLDHLAASPAGLHQEVLVQAVETPKSPGVSMLLRKMEYDLGWISRSIDPQNRRKMIVRLEEKGKAAWSEASPVYQQELQKRFQNFDEQFLTRILEGLKKLRSALLTSP
jgi:DNA-binding MarR family transcriptional regulator